MAERILVWHRLDLRVTDHAPLATACRDGAEVVALYVFDERQFTATPEAVAKTGAFRTRFLLETVEALRLAYRVLGSDLIVRRGRTEELVSALVDELAVDRVYFHTYPTSEELAVERAAVSRLRVPYRSWWGHTLYALEDLPFEIGALPEVFTNFRKVVEGGCAVRAPIAAPVHIRALRTNVGTDRIPSIEDLGVTPPEVDPRAVLLFKGGELEGKARLFEYIWKKDCLKSYKETRNGLLGPDYSSKLSPWLAHGCVSPRSVYAEIKRYEAERVKNDSTYWLTFELLWRDYFAFIASKHGTKLFRASGLRGIVLPWTHDRISFGLWCRGKTGFPLIDANMRELSATGFMSNRGRQNVGSFLTKNLSIDWRWGAAWFESLLVDYDVASNWGNWNYTAGVGNDARGFRFFNTEKQAKDYDPEGRYVKTWLPELAAIPADRVHNPSSLSAADQQRFGVRMGSDYPNPMLDLFKSAAENQELYESAVTRVTKAVRGGHA